MLRKDNLDLLLYLSIDTTTLVGDAILTASHFKEGGGLFEGINDIEVVLEDFWVITKDFSKLGEFFWPPIELIAGIMINLNLRNNEINSHIKLAYKALGNKDYYEFGT